MKRGPYKKVRQLDYYTSEEIEVYDSISDAAYDNWIGYKLLSDVLNNRDGILERKKLKFEFAN